MLADKQQAAEELSKRKYEHGFYTDVESVSFPKGLNEEIVRRISKIKDEPDFLLDFRLKAFNYWKKQTEPNWAHVDYPAVDFNDLRYYSAPKSNTDGPKSLDEVDDEILKTFDRLGIPLAEQKRITGVAVDAVFDSVSVGTTHQDELKKYGVVFCSFSEAVKEYPELVKKYLGSVVPYKDNFYAALNSAVFSDGTFVYIPKGVHCPLDLSPTSESTLLKQVSLN